MSKYDTTATLEADGIKFQTTTAKPDNAYGPDDEAVTLKRIRAEMFKTDRQCAGCKRAFRKSDTPNKYPGMDHVWETFMKNRLTMLEEDLYELIAQDYILHVANIDAEERREVDDWPVDMVRTHIRDHMTDEDLAIEQEIRTYDVMQRELQKMLFIKKADGRRIPNKDAIKLHFEASELKIKLREQARKVR